MELLFLRHANASAFSAFALQRSGALAPRWKVYPQFIPDGDRIVCKTYMTRVEGENTRLRHYLGGAYAPDQAELGTGRSSVRTASENTLLFQIKGNVTAFN